MTTPCPQHFRDRAWHPVRTFFRTNHRHAGFVARGGLQSQWIYSSGLCEYRHIFV